MSSDPQAGVDACTRCGLCLQACPTYRDLKVEADSPRGRVFLVKQLLEGDASVDRNLAEHLYLCLGCRACETACPSGVPFGSILEYGRRRVEGEQQPVTGFGWRLFRHLAFALLLPSRAAFRAAMAPARWLQRSPAIVELFASLPLGERVRTLLRMIPVRSTRRTAHSSDEGDASGRGRARVGLFVGCVMGELFGFVNDALVRVLRHNGCDVKRPPNQWCCGALNVHAGERRNALAMARRNIDAFESDDAGLDAIVVDSAGCGAHMKQYGELLADDPRYAARAAAFSAKVKDASEFLVARGPRTDFGILPLRVTYQDACHLAHGQRVREQPRELIRAIPGIEYVELREADRCCGAAGVYSLTHPVMSRRILDEKISAIEMTGARTVVVTNPGCHMQLLAGIARRKLAVDVVHLVELLDRAYQARATPEALHVR